MCFVWRKSEAHHVEIVDYLKAQCRIIGDLFRAFMEDSRLLPPQFQQQAAADRSRAVSDYIAGMTDRYAIKEHRRQYCSLKKNSVRPELVEGHELCDGWFDKLTTNG